MKKSNSTKKALLTSVLSLFLCVAMLAGSTFAWFTDSVSSKNNIITAGNLDIELYWSVDGKDWKKVDENTNIFKENTLWEPGHTEVVYLKVVNEGSLALKYQLGVNIVEEIEGVNKAGEKFKLSDYIEFGVKETAEALSYATREDALDAIDSFKKISVSYSKSSALYAKNNAEKLATEEYATLVVTMPEDVSNDANHNGVNIPSIRLGITLFATQLAAEEDSFGKDYDEFAWHPEMKVYTANELQSALDNTDGAAVVLMEDVTANVVVTKNAKIDLNGKTLTGSIETNGAKVVVENGKLVNSDKKVSAIQAWSGDLTLNNVEITSARHAVRVEGPVKVTINDGYYKAAGSKSTTQHALNVSGGGEVVINGGTFIGPKGTASDSGSAVNVQSGSTVTIYGGSFSGGKLKTLSSGGTLTVYGGTFDQNPSVYVAENHTVTDNGDGTWTVGMTKSDLKNSIADAVADAIANGETKVEIDAYGADIGGLEYGLNTSLVPAGTTVTIKNAVISGQSYGNAVAGTVVFENCVFDNKTGAYSIHFDAGNGNVVFKNCTLTGWCSYGSAIQSVEMYGCTIKHNGIYGQQRFYQPAVLEDCVIESTVTVDAVSNCDLVVNNCTVDDGSYITDVIYVDDGFTSITIDGKKTVYTQEAFNAAEKANATIYLIGNDSGVVCDLKNNQANGLTIIGLGDDVKMANTTNFAGNGKLGGIVYAINLENITITNTVYTQDKGGNATFTNVYFKAGVRRAYGSGVVFNNCTFGSNSDGYALHFESDGSSTNAIQLNGCKFEGGKVHLGKGRTYAFTGCDFVAGTDFQVWSGVTLDGCTVDGVAITAENIATFFPALNLANVTLDGATVTKN